VTRNRRNAVGSGDRARKFRARKCREGGARLRGAPKAKPKEDWLIGLLLLFLIPNMDGFLAWDRFSVLFWIAFFAVVSFCSGNGE
jgi:hypothetical protein